MSLRTAPRTIALTVLVAASWLVVTASTAFARVPPEPAVLPPATAAADLQQTSVTPYLLIAVIAALVPVVATLVIQAIRRGQVGAPSHA